jgi:tetratricopeptide (TPR) repeat protein
MKTKIFNLLLLFIVSLVIASCAQSNKEKAFILFNEGVSFSLDAVAASEIGNFDKSTELNKKAIDKFLETLKVDSAHLLAPGALGYSYYMIRDFKNGIEWYKKAIKVDPSIAANHLEYGLCLINLGDLTNGNSAIKKALELDSSKESVYHAVYSLLNVGVLAFDYGEEYEEQGENDKGKTYKEFSVAVLLSAHQLDTINQEVIQHIVDFSEIIGYEETVEEFRGKILKN